MRRVLIGGLVLAAYLAALALSVPRSAAQPRINTGFDITRLNVLGGCTTGQLSRFTTSWTCSTATFPGTVAAGNVLYGSATNVVSAATPASTQASPANPTGTANTTGLMMGLAGAITPAVSGRILVTITGNGASDTINDGWKAQIRYGTGAAPANAAALTGTAVGTLATTTADLAANNKNAFSVTAVVTGLTVSTAYWLDLSLAAITGGTATVTDVSISAQEF